MKMQLYILENQQTRPTTLSAAVTILSGEVQIHNCTFRKNSGPQTQTGSLQVTTNNEDSSSGNPTFIMTNTVIEADVQPYTLESTVVSIKNMNEAELSTFI